MDMQRAIEIIQRKSSIPNDSESFEEIEKAYDLAVEALEAIEKIKFIVNEKHYPNATECDYGQYSHCEKALMLYDIEYVLSDLDGEV